MQQCPCGSPWRLGDVTRCPAGPGAARDAYPAQYSRDASIRHDVSVPGWSHGGGRRIWQVCAWIALVVALAVPVVVLLLRGLSDAASAAQLVSLPFAAVSLVIALPAWFRRTGSGTDNHILTTIKDAEPPSRGTQRERKHWHVVLIALALLIAGAEVSTFVFYTAGAFSTEIRAEPVQTLGENPFSPPIGSDQPNVKPPSNVGGTFPGGAVGLYGGTPNSSSCDPDSLVAFLQAHPDKAAAWAGVQGITSDDIPRYVAELTPMFLRSDTAVTNHGFAKGNATTVHSVLQAGTAVLVDKFGVPRVRCYCGNPLTPPQLFSKPRYINPAWPTFSRTNITTIQPVASAINEFPIVNPLTSAILYRPVGTRGERDQGDLRDVAIAGNYTLAVRWIKCIGFEEGCARNPRPMNIRIDCNGNQCSASWLGGGWSVPHLLIREGNTYRTSGEDNFASQCHGSDRLTTIAFEVAVTSAKIVNGAWVPGSLQGRYLISAPAVSGCNAGELEAALST